MKENKVLLQKNIKKIMVIFSFLVLSFATKAPYSQASYTPLLPSIPYIDIEKIKNTGVELSYKITENGESKTKKEILTDVKTAWDKASGKNDALIKFRCDQTISSKLTATDKYRNVTIDLNGFILKRDIGDDCISDGEIICVEKDASIIIIDSNPDYYPDSRKEYDKKYKDEPRGAGGIITGGRNKSYGGGICIKERGYLEIKGGTICDNLSALNGGGVCCEGTLNMTGGAIRFNGSGHQNGDEHIGGGLSIKGDGSVSISDSVFEENDAPYGGAIDIGDSGILNMENCVLKNNNAAISGGALYINGSDSQIILRNCEFTGNYAENGDGGAVWVRGEKVVFAGCDIHDNKAWLDGGGIFAAVVDDKGKGEGSSVNFQGKCIVNNNISQKKKITSNLSVDAKGNKRTEQAVIHVGWLDRGSKIGINRDKAKVNVCLVSGMRELDKTFFFADKGELEFKKSGEKTEIFMATAISPIGKALFIAIGLLIVGIVALMLSKLKKRKKEVNNHEE